MRIPTARASDRIRPSFQVVGQFETDPLPAFSHSFCLRDVAWIRPAYAWTKRGDVGTTSPTVLDRQ
jgi:hypothetical protein